MNVRVVLERPEVYALAVVGLFTLVLALVSAAAEAVCKAVGRRVWKVVAR